MKKNGFTLVELITTFALIAAIIVILTNVVLIIKDLYVKYNIKTELLIKQGDLNSYVNDIIVNGKLVSYSVSNNEYTFNLTDGNSYTLTVTNDTITFENTNTNETYVYKAIEGVTIGQIDASVSQPTFTTGNIIQIKIPINHKLFSNEDFGLNLVYIH